MEDFDFGWSMYTPEGDAKVEKIAKRVVKKARKHGWDAARVSSEIRQGVAAIEDKFPEVNDSAVRDCLWGYVEGTLKLRPES